MQPRRIAMAFLSGAALFLAARPAGAHCDGRDGPVVKAASSALEKKDVALVLPWVKEDDEAEVRAAFTRAVAVRALSPEAKTLADDFFFETVVRLHRAGEGASFTGLKPAGRDLGPAIPAADAALASGKDDALAKLLGGEARDGLHERFARVLAAKNAARPGDVAAGRRYVAEYVAFVHYVERLHEAATTEAKGHEPEHADREGGGS